MNPSTRSFVLFVLVLLAGCLLCTANISHGEKQDSCPFLFFSESSSSIAHIDFKINSFSSPLHICSGVVVRKQRWNGHSLVVLAPANCLMSNSRRSHEGASAFTPIQTSLLRIRMVKEYVIHGDDDEDDGQEEPTQIREIKFHPKFNPFTLDNNIALIEVEQEDEQFVMRNPQVHDDDGENFNCFTQQWKALEQEMERNPSQFEFTLLASNNNEWLKVPANSLRHKSSNFAKEITLMLDLSKKEVQEDDEWFSKSILFVKSPSNSQHDENQSNDDLSDRMIPVGLASYRTNDNQLVFTSIAFFMKDWVKQQLKSSKLLMVKKNDRVADRTSSSSSGHGIVMLRYSFDSNFQTNTAHERAPPAMLLNQSEIIRNIHQRIYSLIHFSDTSSESRASENNHQEMPKPQPIPKPTTRFVPFQNSYDTFNYVKSISKNIRKRLIETIGFDGVANESDSVSSHENQDLSTTIPQPVPKSNQSEKLTRIARSIHERMETFVKDH
ncbi:hypothetical protein FDP41_004015 [Naegleria fowleri]|uniref:Peptidase S1 domain-containing protein n=1 Tax=Naegleria fowleri TaxID=5763 RepID=A0A6A5BSE0_NAEFO|nr:uncharacterized protein FDP41_004015 [Naegleria fowleri]KAF0976720.1 hypothetical protein FDP41_004015 [Naegleria fowleri]